MRAHRLAAAALALAAAGASAQPRPPDTFDAAAERARLGLLGLVQQQVMPRAGGLTAARIYLWAPLRPAPATGWPVIYMLDGTAVFQALSRAEGLAHEAVVVGLGYDSPGRVDGAARAWDYTPRLPGAGPRARRTRAPRRAATAAPRAGWISSKTRSSPGCDPRCRWIRTARRSMAIPMAACSCWRP